MLIDILVCVDMAHALAIPYITDRASNLLNTSLLEINSQVVTQENFHQLLYIISFLYKNIILFETKFSKGIIRCSRCMWGKNLSTEIISTRIRFENILVNIWKRGDLLLIPEICAFDTSKTDVRVASIENLPDSIQRSKPRINYVIE